MLQREPETELAAMLEQNYYEVLEVDDQATVQDIDRAYRIARATYQPTSMATYSLFSDDENADILRRIEEAYAVLSDARMRKEYDARLRREAMRVPSQPSVEELSREHVEVAVRPEVESITRAPEPAPPPQTAQANGAAPEPPTRARSSSSSSSALAAPPLEFTMDLEEPEVPDDGVIDGRVLRHIRIRRGLELEDISQVTKISEMYLGFIEENRYDDLPADVYVRGFLREYAKCLNLEPKGVVESYMQLCHSRSQRARGPHGGTA